MWMPRPCLLFRALPRGRLTLPRGLVPCVMGQAKVVFQDANEGAAEGIEGLDTLVVEIRGMGKKRLGCVPVGWIARPRAS